MSASATLRCKSGMHAWTDQVGADRCCDPAWKRVACFQHQAESLDPHGRRFADGLVFGWRHISAIPTNVRELVAYLMAHPRVRITGPTPQSREPITREEEYFNYFEGRMWFAPDDGDEEHFIPIGCKLKAAAASETSLEFDEAGFTVWKFGARIRVEYLREEAPKQ